MNHKTIHLLDLPDEILLIIMKKLDTMDVLYSLLGVNKRLNQMARSINETMSLDFSTKLSNDEFSSFDRVKFDRFLYEILPQIHYNVIGLTLDFFSMKHVLLTCEYPNLRMIVTDNYPLYGLLRDLTEESSIAHTCSNILVICTKLSYLNINQPVKSNHAKLSLWDRSSNVCYSLHLRTLIIDVKHFDDCLHLLDGRLEQLSSFTVNIHSIERFSMIDNNQKIVSNLKEFSLTCYSTTKAYRSRILPLLRRMPNLNSLTLHLNIKQSKVIDGIHLNEKILRHMLHLNTFIFNICAIVLTSEINHFLSTNDIENTFINWKYSPVICCVDHLSDRYTYSHIYSAPFKMNCFMYLTNSFHDHHLEYVIDLVLYDTNPFEHEFFEWISQGFPLLKHLTVNNLTPQKQKYQIESVNDKQIFSKISYLHLVRLKLTDAHINYADQFLRDQNAYVPCLHALTIQYEQLVTVTNNFTNDATRFNCRQLTKIKFDKLPIYPEHFYLYFFSLSK
ncbi:unnamed protein product [Rotaria sordida]|uniref:F-box domain-containing protein n=1 Tax=Rotaria sordida TaxID=392033 RepID=A0A819UCB4_9BILA|nr:unnamed protein product [Rotaria sordida]CAF3927470.1 unnamed protein product [Rotaria sordida]CAF4092873.1 unnamed protein product [Rotaria sordida]